MDLYINSYGTYLHKVGEMFELEAELDGKKIKQKIYELRKSKSYSSEISSRSI